MDEGEEFIPGFLFLVLLTDQSNPDPSGDIPDAPGPDEVVKSVVDSDVIGEHVLFGEESDFSDGDFGFPFELEAVASFVEVDGVVSSDGGQVLLVGFTGHGFIE